MLNDTLPLAVAMDEAVSAAKKVSYYHPFMIPYHHVMIPYHNPMISYDHPMIPYDHPMISYDHT